MPPKPKRKRASFNQTVTVKAAPEFNDVSVASDEEIENSNVQASPSVGRQVVEIVEEPVVPEAIETIKKDAQEIEDAVENLEEAVEKTLPEKHVSSSTSNNNEEVIEEKIEEEKPNDVVETLFSSRTSEVRPEITVVGKKDKSLAVWVGAMLGIAVAVGVGLVFLVKGPNSISSIGAKPTPTASPTITPSPTVIATVERKDISVRVLNGGGVVGAASKMKTFLEDKGYKVVSTGNTPEYTYDSTVIQVKEGRESYKTMLTDDLKVDYTMGTSTEAVASDAAYDAIVIVGKE